jgi:hypothetical protein
LLPVSLTLIDDDACVDGATQEDVQVQDNKRVRVCQCTAGYFVDGVDAAFCNSVTRCVRCEVGLVCTGKEPLQHVTLEPGYFRVSAFSRDVVECPVPTACSSSSFPATTVAATATATTTTTTTDDHHHHHVRDFGDSLCARNLGYEGPLCMVCHVSANATYYFDGNKCVKCADERDAGLVLLSMLIACVVLAAILYQTGVSAKIYRS